MVAACQPARLLLALHCGIVGLVAKRLQRVQCAGCLSCLLKPQAGCRNLEAASNRLQNVLLCSCEPGYGLKNGRCVRCKDHNCSSCPGINKCERCFTDMNVDGAGMCSCEVR